MTALAIPISQSNGGVISNTIAQYNVLHDIGIYNLQGGAIECILAGPTPGTGNIFHYNLMYSIGDAHKNAFPMNVQGRSGGCSFYGNVVYDSYGPCMSVHKGPGGNRFYNNTCYNNGLAGAQALASTSMAAPPIPEIFLKTTSSMPARFDLHICHSRIYFQHLGRQSVLWGHRHALHLERHRLQHGQLPGRKRAGCPLRQRRPAFTKSISERFLPYLDLPRHRSRRYLGSLTSWILRPVQFGPSM